MSETYLKIWLSEIKCRAHLLNTGKEFSNGYILITRTGAHYQGMYMQKDFFIPDCAPGTPCYYCKLNSNQYCFTEQSVEGAPRNDHTINCFS